MRSSTGITVSYEEHSWRSLGLQCTGTSRKIWVLSGKTQECLMWVVWPADAWLCRMPYGCGCATLSPRPMPCLFTWFISACSPGGTVPHIPKDSNPPLTSGSIAYCSQAFCPALVIFLHNNPCVSSVQSHSGRSVLILYGEVSLCHPRPAVMQGEWCRDEIPRSPTTAGLYTTSKQASVQWWLWVRPCLE